MTGYELAGKKRIEPWRWMINRLNQLCWQRILSLHLIRDVKDCPLWKTLLSSFSNSCKICRATEIVSIYCLNVWESWKFQMSNNRRGDHEVLELTSLRGGRLPVVWMNEIINMAKKCVLRGFILVVVVTTCMIQVRLGWIFVGGTMGGPWLLQVIPRWYCRRHGSIFQYSREGCSRKCQPWC